MMKNAGICQASIALFTELEIVIEMISIGTLLVFYLVANALIYRRYAFPSSSSSSSSPQGTLLYLFLLLFCSIGFSMSWKNIKKYWWGLPLFGTLLITITALFQLRMRPPPPPATAADDYKWSVPLMPWPAAISIFMNVFLMTTLKKLSYQRFGVWTCFITLFYVFYGVHSTYRAEEEITRDEVIFDDDDDDGDGNLRRITAIATEQQQPKLDAVLQLI